MINPVEGSAEVTFTGSSILISDGGNVVDDALGSLYFQMSFAEFSAGISISRYVYFFHKLITISSQRYIDLNSLHSFS